MCRLVPYQNSNRRVADIKLKYIENIAKQAEACKGISRIMLFGSSLEERCSDRSDIDIAVFGTQPREKYQRSKEYRDFHRNVFLFDLNQDYDILYFPEGSKEKPRIMNDIEKGIEIFRRETA